MELEFTGLIDDNRSEAQKAKDYKFEEIVASANPVEWKEKPESEWRTFPSQDQLKTYTCVANTLAKLMGINFAVKEGEYVPFSRSHIYQRRYNKPGEGMVGYDAFEIAQKGVTLESLVPFPINATDQEVDKIVIKPHENRVGECFKLGKYVELPKGDIDTVASIIETTKKGVMVWFYFTSPEWSKKQPTVDNPSLNQFQGLRHSVTAVDFTLINGKKALIIEDSAHFGGIDRRIITEDFFKARNTYGAYFIDFKYEEVSPTPEKIKPRYKFENVLKFGNSNEDVNQLQKILQYEGLFPNNVSATNYYGSITAKAVLEFQKKYNVASLEELNSLQGKITGRKTINKLNELYYN